MKCETHHHACDCREAMFARAVEIANESMVELLMAHAKRADEHGITWALVNADGVEVPTLDEADLPVIEAVEWLREHKLCELIESPHGATVLLLCELEEQDQLRCI